MGTHRNGQPGEEPVEENDERELGGALRHPNRTHVTLANLADLNLASFASKPAGESTDEAADGGAANGESAHGDAGHGHAANGGWLAQLPAPPVEESPRLKRRGRGEPVGPDAPPGPDGGGASPSNGRAAGEVIAPDAVAKAPPSRQVVVPGKAKLRGAYGIDTGEHRAWVVPSARLRHAEPDPQASVRAGWARLFERWLLELMALAVAAVAFVAPVVWLLVVALATVVGAVVAYVASGHPAATLPAHALRRAVSLLRPRSVVWVPVFAARTVIAAILLPAGVAATVWFIGHGGHGAVVAARAGAWAYGFRVAAVLLCLMLLTSVGDGRQQRAVTVKRWAAPATDGTLTILAATCLVVGALAVVGAPHPADSIAARADGLGWLPPGTRAAVDRVRDDIVTTELDSLAECLSTQGGTLWKPFYTVENPTDEPDVARLVAGREPSFSPPRDLVTVILAAHNQLAPWVEAIEIEWPGGDVVRTERASLPRYQPLLDGARLVPATTAGGQWVSSGSVDEGVALRCSAAPVL
jgi:hypothetical protein